jgi:hypothetical protein
VKGAGAHVWEAGFQPPETARRARAGGEQADPGAVLGSAGAVAGVWVTEVADADAALDWARRIPTASYGTVEVRPIVEFEG